MAEYSVVPRIDVSNSLPPDVDKIPLLKSLPLLQLIRINSLDEGSTSLEERPSKHSSDVGTIMRLTLEL